MGTVEFKPEDWAMVRLLAGILQEAHVARADDLYAALNAAIQWAPTMICDPESWDGLAPAAQRRAVTAGVAALDVRRGRA